MFTVRSAILHCSFNMAVSKSPFMLRVVMKVVRSLFPTVKKLETEVLNGWMKDENTNDFVLLDVRENDEYKVSHLPEAIFVEPEAPANTVIAKVSEKALAKGLYKSNVNVITYCAVGRRASVMAQRIEEELEKRKATEGRDEKITIKVHNLEGAIFKWTNEERCLVDSGGKETKYCHPYNWFFGLMIPPHTRKYL